MKRSMKDIERLSEEQTAEFLRRSSITYLESCISLMLMHIGKDQVADILEQEAIMLRELD